MRDTAENSNDKKKEEAKPKPSFETLTSLVNTKGFWNENSISTISRYFVGEDIDDTNLNQQMT